MHDDDRFQVRPIDPRFAAERRRTLAMLIEAVGAHAEVLEVGSTAIDGVIGKGDLDVLVRAPAEVFASVRARLDEVLTRNPHQLSNEIYQGYVVESPLDVAVQCTVTGGPYDDFESFLWALRRDPGLVQSYNALKRRWDGASMTDYRAAKQAFIQGVLEGEGAG